MMAVSAEPTDVDGRPVTAVGRYERAKAFNIEEKPVTCFRYVPVAHYEGQAFFLDPRWRLCRSAARIEHPTIPATACLNASRLVTPTGSGTSSFSPAVVCSQVGDCSCRPILAGKSRGRIVSRLCSVSVMSRLSPWGPSLRRGFLGVMRRCLKNGKRFSTRTCNWLCNSTQNSSMLGRFYIKAGLDPHRVLRHLILHVLDRVRPLESENEEQIGRPWCLRNEISGNGSKRLHHPSRSWSDGHMSDIEVLGTADISRAYLAARRRTRSKDRINVFFSIAEFADYLVILMAYVGAKVVLQVLMEVMVCSSVDCGLSLSALTVRRSYLVYEVLACYLGHRILALAGCPATSCYGTIVKALPEATDGRSKMAVADGGGSRMFQTGATARLNTLRERRVTARRNAPLERLIQATSSLLTENYSIPQEHLQRLRLLNRRFRACRKRITRIVEHGGVAPARPGCLGHCDAAWCCFASDIAGFYPLYIEEEEVLVRGIYASRLARPPSRGNGAREPVTSPFVSVSLGKRQRHGALQARQALLKCLWVYRKFLARTLVHGLARMGRDATSIASKSLALHACRVLELLVHLKSAEEGLHLLIEIDAFSLLTWSLDLPEVPDFFLRLLGFGRWQDMVPTVNTVLVDHLRSIEWGTRFRSALTPAVGSWRMLWALQLSQRGFRDALASQLIADCGFLDFYRYFNRGANSGCYEGTGRCCCCSYGGCGRLPSSGSSLTAWVEQLLQQAPCMSRTGCFKRGVGTLLRHLLVWHKNAGLVKPTAGSRLCTKVRGVQKACATSQDAFLALVLNSTFGQGLQQDAARLLNTLGQCVRLAHSASEALRRILGGGTRYSRGRKALNGKLKKELRKIMGTQRVLEFWAVLCYTQADEAVKWFGLLLMAFVAYHKDRLQREGSSGRKISSDWLVGLPIRPLRFDFQAPRPKDIWVDHLHQRFLAVQEVLVTECPSSLEFYGGKTRQVLPKSLIVSLRWLAIILEVSPSTALGWGEGGWPQTLYFVMRRCLDEYRTKPPAGAFSGRFVGTANFFARFLETLQAPALNARLMRWIETGATVMAPASPCWWGGVNRWGVCENGVKTDLGLLSEAENARAVLMVTQELLGNPEIVRDLLETLLWVPDHRAAAAELLVDFLKQMSAERPLGALVLPTCQPWDFLTPELGSALVSVLLELFDAAMENRQPSHTGSKKRDHLHSDLRAKVAAPPQCQKKTESEGLVVAHGDKTRDPGRSGVLRSPPATVLPFRVTPLILNLLWIFHFLVERHWVARLGEGPSLIHCAPERFWKTLTSACLTRGHSCSLLLSRCCSLWVHVLQNCSSEVLETVFLKSGLLPQYIAALLNESNARLQRKACNCRGELGALADLGFLLADFWESHHETQGQLSREKENLVPEVCLQTASLATPDLTRSAETTSRRHVTEQRSSTIWNEIGSETSVMNSSCELSPPSPPLPTQPALLDSPSSLPRSAIIVDKARHASALSSALVPTGPQLLNGQSPQGVLQTYQTENYSLAGEQGAPVGRGPPAGWIGIDMRSDSCTARERVPGPLTKHTAQLPATSDNVAIHIVKNQKRQLATELSEVEVSRHVQNDRLEPIRRYLEYAAKDWEVAFRFLRTIRSVRQAPPEPIMPLEEAIEVRGERKAAERVARLERQMQCSTRY